MNGSSASETSPRIVLLAAGGTGGHIFPAIALGQSLTKNHPGVTVVYACGERELERRLYAEEGITPKIFPARQIGRGMIAPITAAFAALANMLRAFVYIRKNHIDAVIGMGGYVSGPTVFAGILAHKPTLIHEANSVPGKTNKILAPWVTLTTTHFPSTLTHLKTRNGGIAVGMPIRESVSHGDKETAQAFFTLDRERKTILILGGSQGARYLYDTLMKALPYVDHEQNNNIQILWSTGTGNFDELRTRLKENSLKHIKVLLVPFINRMDLAYAAADAAIARAGASTLAELTACGIFTVYIPFPAAIYDHQTLNAAEAANAGIAELIPEKALTAESAANAITKLAQSAREGKIENIPDSLNSLMAANRLGDLVMKLIHG